MVFTTSGLQEPKLCHAFPHASHSRKDRIRAKSGGIKLSPVLKIRLKHRNRELTVTFWLLGFSGNQGKSGLKITMFYSLPYLIFMQAEFLFRKHKCRAKSQRYFFGSFFFFSPWQIKTHIRWKREQQRDHPQRDGQLWEEVENRIGKKERQSWRPAEGQRPWVGGGPTHPTHKLFSLRQQGAISLKSTYHKEGLTLPVPSRHDWNRDIQSQNKSRQSEVTNVMGIWLQRLTSRRVLAIPVSESCTIRLLKLHIQLPKRVPSCDYDQKNLLLN